MNKNHFLYILLFLIIAGCRNQVSSNWNIEEFKRFNELKSISIFRTELFGKIIPNEDYVYWEVIYMDIGFPESENENFRGKVIFKNGDENKFNHLTQNTNSYSGFFSECTPGICYTYIVALTKDSKIKLINTEKKLIEFIGEVDNETEVFMNISANGFTIDSDTNIASSYKEQKNDYLLYMASFSEGLDSTWSIKAKLEKTGSLEIINKELYQTLEYQIVF